MLFCPNLTNKQVKLEFDELRNVFGEAVAYYIWDKNNGYSLDKAPNGAKSNLFEDLLNIYHGDRELALKAKFKTYTPQFVKWFDGSKVVDENGEPRVMWHGGAKDVHKFRPSGDTTGSGYYTDPRNGNKVPVDSVRAMFFSTNMLVGLSYAEITGYYHYEDLRDKLENVLVNSSENEISATVGVIDDIYELIDVLENASDFNPRFKKAAVYIRTLKSDNKKIDKKTAKALYHLIRNTINDIRSEVHQMLITVNATSGNVAQALNAIRFVDEYNTPNGRTKLLAGEIPAWIKKEWGVYKQKELNRTKAGQTQIANYETLVFYSDSTLHRNIGYDGAGIFAGEGDYITKLSDNELEQLLADIKNHAKVEIDHLKSLKGFLRSHSKSQLYPVYLSIKKPLEHDYEGTLLGYGYKESKKTPFGFVAATQVDKAIRDGNDGVIYKNLYDPYFADNYGVFNPNQIKSVHNEGPFSENNDDIYYHIGQDATYSESAEDAAWVNNAVTVVEEMRKVFPELQVKIATEEDLVGIRYGVTSFVRNGVVYLIPGVETSEEVVLEECLHPLISAVQQSNPVLFDKLFSEAKRKYKRLDNEIQKNYSDELFTDEDRQNELVTQALSKELREIRHNKEGVVTKLVGMFHQFVQNILSKLGIGIKDGKSTIKPQDLPNILSLKKLAKLINTQNTKFELQIDNRILYHVSNPQQSHEYTDMLVKAFTKQYNKQRTILKTKENQEYLDELFYTLSDIKSKCDIEAIENAAKFAVNHLGGLQIAIKDTLYDKLSTGTTNDFTNFTPLLLFDMYNNEISFIQNVRQLLPRSSAIRAMNLPLDVADDITIIDHSLTDVVELWEDAIRKVGDRVIDEFVDRFVTETTERKELLKQNMRDELHENVLFGDVSTLNLIANYSFSTSDILKASFHAINDAEQRAREKTLEEETPILDTYKKCRNLFPGNWQRKMMEYDNNGNPTGYWVRSRNYGLFKQDYSDFMSQLADEFQNKYGFYYKTDDAGNVVKTSTGEYADDETWTVDVNGNYIMPTYYEWKLRENDWLEQHAHRRYSGQYYRERMSTPFIRGLNNGHGLSPKTLSLYDKVQREMNYYLERCTRNDGIAHVEDLTDEELLQLETWQQRMQDLTNPFHKDGSSKSYDEQTIAYEIRAWQRWLNDQLDTKIQTQQWVDEISKLVKLRHEAIASGDTDALTKADRTIRVFYQFNSQRSINQEFIDKTIGMFLTIHPSENVKVTQARINVRALTNLTLTNRNTIEPQLLNFEGHPEFFIKYRTAQNVISDEGLPAIHNDLNGVKYKDVFDANFKYENVKYVISGEYGKPGAVYEDKNGNQTTDQNQAVTFYVHLRNKYTNLITDSYFDRNRGNNPVTLFGWEVLTTFINNQTNQQQTMYFTDFLDWFYNFTKSTYTRDEVRDAAESFVEKYIIGAELLIEATGEVKVLPLNIFKYLSPRYSKFDTGRTDETGNKIFADTIHYKPTGRFVEKSNKTEYLLDDHYDKQEGGNTQPTRSFYDNSKAFDEVNNNSKLKALYDILTEKLAEIIKQLSPSVGAYDYRLPQIEGSLSAVTSRIQHAGLRNVANYIKQSLFGILSKDYDMRNGAQLDVNPDGTPNASAPRRFIKFVEDPTTISSNLVGGVLLMMLMKNNFHLKNDVLSKVFLLYENLNPQHREGDSKYKAKNMSRLMKNLITTHIMDMRNQGEFDESKSQLTNKHVAAQKVISHTKYAAMLNMLCGNLLSAFVGFFDSLTGQVMHGIVGKYYSLRDWSFGLTMALCNLPQTLVNIGNPIPNNKLVALMRLNGVSKSLNESYEKLYKSRAGKIVKAGLQVGMGALAGHLLGQTGWFGAENAAMYAGLGMGIYSVFDYFSNQILLAAHYHHIRFYDGYMDSDGTELVPAGFYTRKLLKRAFQNAGLEKQASRAGITRAWHGLITSLYDAYQFNNGTLSIKDKYAPYVTDELKTLISTMTQKRAALMNGMNPDNDIPYWRNTIVGKLIASLRGFMMLSLQHNYVSGHSFVKRETEDVKDRNVTGGVVRENSKNKRKKLDADLYAERGGFDWESDAMQDSVVTEIGKSLQVLGKMITSFLKTGTRGGYRFSGNASYAFKEVLGLFLILAGLVWNTINATKYVQDHVTPSVGAQWDPKMWIDNQVYAAAWMDLSFRVTESKVSFYDPTQMYDIVSSVTTLSSGLNNYLEIINAAEDAAGLSKHSPDDIIKTGAYKGETRSTRQLYKFAGVPGNLHTVMSYSGAVANYTYYLNKFGGFYDILGQDMRVSQSTPQSSSNEWGFDFDAIDFDASGFDMSEY